MRVFGFVLVLFCLFVTAICFNVTFKFAGF